MHSKCLASVLLMLPLPLLAAQPAEPYLEKTALFERETGGYTVYRIPGLIVTRAGTVLAYAEARKNERSDWGESAIVMRRSTDGGRTWSVATILGAMRGPFP